MNKENILTTFITNNLNEGTLPHAFLVETNTSHEIIDNIYKIFSKNGYLAKVKLENNQDIMIIEEENNIIDKNKILDLQSFLLLKPISSKCKLYFIDNCEKMNISAANKLLKTLEEPAENIFAFLLTKNINDVIPTIKSRCEIFRIKTNNNNLNEYDEIVSEIILFKYNNYCDFLNLKHKIIEYDKNQIIEIINIVKNKILTISNDYQTNLKKYKIYDNIESGLKYNTNLELTLDKLYIEMEKVV